MDRQDSLQNRTVQDQVDNSKRNIVAALLGSLGVAALAGCTNQVSGDTSAEPIKRIAEAITGTQQLRWVSWIGTSPGAHDLNLRNLDGPTHGEIVIAEGFWEPGDGGGGIFYWDETSCTDDGGTIIVPNTNAPVPPYQGSSGACWKRIYSGPLNVKWFGAKGNGTDEDTSSLLLAANALSSSPAKALYFPKGTYKTTGTIPIAAAGSRLEGEGPQSIIWKSNSATITCAVEITASGCTVRDLAIRGPHTTALLVSDEVGIYAHGSSDTARCTGFNVFNCEISNFGSDGLRCLFVDRVTVSDSYLHDCGYAGAQMLSCNDGVFRGNRIRAIAPGQPTSEHSNMYGVSLNTRSGEIVCGGWIVAENEFCGIDWEAIDSHRASRVLVSGNRIRSCYRGIILGSVDGGNASVSVSDIQVVGNMVDAGEYSATADYGINVQGNGQYQLRSAVIANNAIRGFTKYASSEIAVSIRVNRIDGLAITNNVVKDFGGYGLYLGEWIRAGVIDGNTFFEAVEGTPRVIFDEVNQSSSTVSTRSYSNNRGVANTSEGLRISYKTGETVDTLVASGNRFVSNATGFYEFVNWPSACPIWPPPTSSA